MFKGKGNQMNKAELEKNLEILLRQRKMGYKLGVPRDFIRAINHQIRTTQNQLAREVR